MDLKQLGEQYQRQSDILIERIHKLNSKLKLVKGNELIVMKRRIFSLYTDAAECRRYAALLKNYKKGEPHNEQNDLQP